MLIGSVFYSAIKPDPYSGAFIALFSLMTFAYGRELIRLATVRKFRYEEEEL